MAEADYNGLLSRWREGHAIYLAVAAARLGRWAKTCGLAEPAAEIMAEEVVVEVVDKATGQMFRRILPLQYYESGHGVVLSGEALNGGPCQIAFFSDAALAKMPGLFGRGPDGPRCGETGDGAER